MGREGRGIRETCDYSRDARRKRKNVASPRPLRALNLYFRVTRRESRVARIVGTRASRVFFLVVTEVARDNVENVSYRDITDTRDIADATCGVVSGKKKTELYTRAFSSFLRIPPRARARALSLLTAPLKRDSRKGGGKVDRYYIFSRLGHAARFGNLLIALTSINPLIGPLYSSASLVRHSSASRLSPVSRSHLGAGRETKRNAIPRRFRRG